MNELKELIDKLWDKKISPAEQSKFLELINKDSDQLKSELLQDYEHNLHTEKNAVTEKRFQSLLKKLHIQIEDHEQQLQPKTLPLYHWIKWVAALLIITLGTIIYTYQHKYTSKQAMVSSRTTKKTSRFCQQYNNGKTVMKISLSDGSTVKLQPGSSLSYYEPFSSMSRNISMKGEATFKVAKDKKHPFIVNAKGFTTTALGTAFTINTKRANHISVKLLEGKVVVKTTKTAGMAMKEIFLVPGQQLFINTFSKQQFVTRFDLDQKIAEQKKLVTMAHIAPMVFNEEPLDNVFNLLAKRNNVEVSYDGINVEEIQKLYFTGTFGVSETLDVILPTICNMNDLTFKQTSSKIVISKQK